MISVGAVITRDEFAQLHIPKHRLSELDQAPSLARLRKRGFVRETLTRGQVEFYLTGRDGNVRKFNVRESFSAASIPAAGDGRQGRVVTRVQGLHAALWRRDGLLGRFLAGSLATSMGTHPRR
jgi:hypothetical protein